MDNNKSAGVWVKVDHYICKIEQSAMLNETVDAEFGGDLMVQIRTSDLAIINAVDGYGHNLRERYQSVQAMLLYESPAPMLPTSMSETSNLKEGEVVYRRRKAVERAWL